MTSLNKKSTNVCKTHTIVSTFSFVKHFKYISIECILQIFYVFFCLSFIANLNNALAAVEVSEFIVVYKNKSQNGIFQSPHTHAYAHSLIHTYTAKRSALSLRRNQQQQKVKPKQFQCQRDANVRQKSVANYPPQFVVWPSPSSSPSRSPCLSPYQSRQAQRAQCSARNA